MQKRLPISVCMISGAEASRIGRALDSVTGWVEEIIVVLNGDVQDATEALAKQRGAQVFREPWKGHVAQKNSAASKATSDWLLGLDADEEVSRELRAEIEAVIVAATSNAHCDAFSFPRLSWYCGRWIRHGDWYPDRKTRLWRRGRGEWGGLDPHDKLQIAGKVGKLKSPLLHYSNDSIAAQLAKIAPYQSTFVQRQLGSDNGAGLFHLTIRPWWRFMRAYFFRLGFLDGWQGLYIAALNSFSTMTRYAMVREARTKDGRTLAP